jgi:hypothetical protein
MQLCYRQPPDERIVRAQSPNDDSVWVVWRYDADLRDNEWSTL